MSLMFVLKVIRLTVDCLIWVLTQSRLTSAKKKENQRLKHKDFEYIPKTKFKQKISLMSESETQRCTWGILPSADKWMTLPKIAHNLKLLLIHKWTLSYHLSLEPSGNCQFTQFSWSYTYAPAGTTSIICMQFLKTRI